MTIKRTLIILVCLIIIMQLGACSKKSTIVPEKNYYLDFIDDTRNEDTQRFIRAVKKELLKHNYIFVSDRITISEKGVPVEKKVLDPSHQEVHVFKDIKEYKTDELNAFKIIINVSAIHEYHGFKLKIKILQKRGGPDWESYMNPGEFTLSGEEFHSHQDVYDHAVDLIVKLTFK